MEERNINITHLVRGMAWHDIGKPFNLGTGGHIWLGYRLLQEAGYPNEGMVALMHGSSDWKSLKEVIKSYLKESQSATVLPAFLLLTNPIDRLSASVYSLLSRQFDRDKFLGRNVENESDRNPLFHAWQNMFSRLPMHSEYLGDIFIIRESYDKASVSHSRVEQLEHPLRNRLVDTLPGSWNRYIDRETLDQAIRSDAALEAEPRDDVDGQVLLETLLRFQTQYPERTYPPANDTTLQEHCRLSGALAFILYRNLEQNQSPWFTQQMWLETKQGNNRYLVGNPNDSGQPREIHTILQEKDGWTEPQKAACNHSEASLVRIAFEGHRNLFERAVRVDDLLGARALTERFLDQFEEQLANVLGAPDLIWPLGGEDRRCLLTIHRSQFDLFYLLPPHPAEDDKLTIQEVVRKAYEKTLKKITGELQRDLERDFRKAVGAGVLSFAADENKALEKQLRALGYRVHILDLSVKSGDQVDTFAAFTSQYGEALVNNFRHSRKYPRVPLADLPIQAERDEDVQLPTDKVCDVCGNHPVFERFVELLDDEAWKSYVQKVVHHFREEPEHPCISCIARRILSHGMVAEETQKLATMVAWDDENYPPRKLRAKLPGEIRTLQTEKNSAILYPPPALVASVEFESDDDFRDLGAAYARYKRDEAGASIYEEPPQLFPTIGYAADANSNVILLALQPTGMLDKAYNYISSAYVIGDLPRKVRKGDRKPQGDQERWQASFALIYRWAQANQGEELAKNMVLIKPHLARVLERIRHIRDFYRTLKAALEAKPMCVLPLDVEFPTLRLLLPADQLDQALRVLDQVVTESLFSATYHEDTEARREAHEFLKLVLPDLLHGAVVLFKQKFPLYLALEAERDILHQLAASDPDEPIDQRTRPGNSQWYGFRLGFSDLRGSLSEVGPLHAEATYENLGQVLDLVDKVDRRTVLQYKQTAEYISLELAQAQAMVRTRRVRGLNPTHVKAFSDEEDDLFKPVHFIKRAIRR